MLLKAGRAVVGPENRFRIAPFWKDRTALLCGNGPSLTRSDAMYFRGDFVCTVNNAVEIFPEADILWFTDAKWYREHMVKVQSFTGIRATLENYDLQSEIDGLWCIHNMGVHGYYPHNDGVMCGGNGGYAALHTLINMGFARIVLLGFDCKPGLNGWHWHGDHSPPLHNPSIQSAANWIKNFRELAIADHGVEILNATPDSALDCFKDISR
jgi:hypothetical protein